MENYNTKMKPISLKLKSFTISLENLSDMLKRNHFPIQK